MTSPDVVNFLLVDDLEENLIALEALLRRDGLRIFKAKSGPEALELLLVHEFALALLDVQMTGMDGFELAELMRGTERTRRVPIMFLTAVATDERRRFRGYEAGAVDYLFKPVAPDLLRNKVNIYFELARQRQELSQQRDELQARGEQLSDALAQLQAHRDNSPLAVVQFDSDFRLVTWSEGAERMFGWKAPEVVGARMEDLAWIHEDDIDALTALRSETLSGRQKRSVLIGRARRKDGSIIECEWYYSALVDASGRLLSFNAQILDITSRRRAEDTQTLLIGELNHRVKNMLSTIQSIATQTLRHSANPAEFAAKFSGRIQSLAQTHSLLSSATWQGTTLSALIHDQMQLGIAAEDRFSITGPEIHLPPQASFHLALILYELGTNAAKHGALSTVDGKVTIDWRMENGHLHLKWSECSGLQVSPPNKRGFGTTLIERSMKAEGGSARASYRTGGVIWDIVLPLQQPAMPAVATIAAEVESGIRRVGAALPVEAATNLRGRRILIVEDEALIGLELAAMLEDAGAEVVGPAGTVDHALEIIGTAPLDAALLDGNLHGRPVDDVAAALAIRRVPFLFVSGYGVVNLPQPYQETTVLAKPFTEAQLIKAAAQLIPQRENIV